MLTREQLIDVAVGMAAYERSLCLQRPFYSILRAALFFAERGDPWTMHNFWRDVRHQFNVLCLRPE